MLAIPGGSGSIVLSYGWRPGMEHALQARLASDEVLGEIVRRIVLAGDPHQIVLFGSRARGDSAVDSDIDILVIEESDQPRYKRSPRYYRATCGTFPARDIVVWTPEEIRQWEAVPNHFVTAALREGRILYERAS